MVSGFESCFLIGWQRTISWLPKQKCFLHFTGLELCKLLNNFSPQFFVLNAWHIFPYMMSSNGFDLLQQTKYFHTVINIKSDNKIDKKTSVCFIKEELVDVDVNPETLRIAFKGWKNLWWYDETEFYEIGFLYIVMNNKYLFKFVSMQFVNIKLNSICFHGLTILLKNH